MPSLRDGAWSDGAQGSKAFGNHNPQTPSGLGRGLDACADFITILGSPCSSLQQQHEGMLTVTKSPQHLAEPAACGTNSGKVQGGVSHAQPAALAHSSCSRVQTLALKGPQETSLSS